MNINPAIFTELAQNEFLVKPCKVGGVDCYLVVPNHIGAKFTTETRIFRSSIWTVSGELVSAGFPKFWNIGEQPQLAPDPTEEQLRNAYFPEKIDGSCLIVSKLHGQLITRTRGTVDARQLDNGWEIDHLIKRYPKAFDNSLLWREDYTLLFEWVTPNNQIVLAYPEPDIFLVGGVRHENYNMLTQWELDDLAQLIGVRRPQYYNLRKMGYQQLVDFVKDFKGHEGICVYYPISRWPFWEIKKVKSEDYLAKHAFKSNISLETVLNFYLAIGELAYQDTLDALQEQFKLDFETLQIAIPYVSRVVDARVKINDFLAGAAMFIHRENLQQVSRKEAALKIIGAYGNTGRSSFLFHILDGKKFTPEMLKKLYYQFLSIKK